MHFSKNWPLRYAQVDHLREHYFTHLRQIMGVDDLSGIELAGRIRLVASLYETLASQHAGMGDVSAPRWRVLMRLFGEEKHGNSQGLTPTELSRMQLVSKNATSALLRGLEEQGLIQRTLDSDDRRIFRIQLTQAGRELIRASAPGHLLYLNQIAFALSPEERAQLNVLLDKLQHSLQDAATSSTHTPSGG
jgi:DNA-binding MarR family transcriptional regulator